jgi:hypothetical protein
VSVFDKSFLFIDNPSNDDLAAMKAAGFEGAFGNVRDYAPALWSTHRAKAQALGMFFGPWGRTSYPNTDVWDPSVLDLLVATADSWNSPLLVNSEKELDGTGASLTSQIAAKVGARDAAVSMQAFLFYDTDWNPIGHLPILLQIFPAESPSAKDPEGCRRWAHQRGCQCVYFTFGTYGGMKPGDFDLKSPYSLFPADAVSVYPLWSPTSSGFIGCQEEDVLTPTQKKRFREEIVSFTKLAEQYEERWSYTQDRPYSGLGAAPQTWHHDDCSSYCALVFYWAMKHTGVKASDPLDYHYSGYGNTQSAIDYLDAHNAPKDKYRVGDMAIYGSRSNTKHMTICRKSGTGASAIWSSFGQQAGPEPHPLHYRNDLVGVYRHPALL